MSIESMMLSNHLNLWHHLLLLPSIFPSIRVFSSELALCIRWPKYWSFSGSISPSNEYSGLIAFRIDWFDLLAVQETLKSLLQYHSSKASILQHSAFFMIQLSHLYMTTGKTTALTIWTLVSKVIRLLLNMAVKHLSISWLQSLSAVTLEPKKIKSVTVSFVSPSICQEVMELDAMILVFWMKYWTEWITNWNQDCWEKYQQPQIRRWYNTDGRKWRETKEPLGESERGQWKSWFES